MKILDPDNMMKVRAVSPLELSEALHAWGTATDALRNHGEAHPLLELTGPAGATDEEIDANDTRGVSKRICAGLFEWLKEV